MAPAGSCLELLVKPLGRKACGRALARARDQRSLGAPQGQPCPGLLVLGCPAASHIPSPVPPSRLLRWPPARLESPCPSRLFLPSSSPGPIDRAVSAPRWAPPFPALLTQCSGSQGGFRLSREREEGRGKRERRLGLAEAAGWPLTPSRLRRTRRSWDEGRSWKTAPGGEAVGGGKSLKFLQAWPFRGSRDGTGEPWPGCQQAASSQPALKAALLLQCPVRTAGPRCPGWRSRLRRGQPLQTGFREVLLAHGLTLGMLRVPALLAALGQC